MLLEGLQRARGGGGLPCVAPASRGAAWLTCVRARAGWPSPPVGATSGRGGGSWAAYIASACRVRATPAGEAPARPTRVSCCLHLRSPWRSLGAPRPPVCVRGPGRRSVACVWHWGRSATPSSPRPTPCSACQAAEASKEVAASRGGGGGACTAARGGWRALRGAERAARGSRGARVAAHVRARARAPWREGCRARLGAAQASAPFVKRTAAAPALRPPARPAARASERHRRARSPVGGHGLCACGASGPRGGEDRAAEPA